MIHYIRLCLRYWWVILIITLISAASAAYLSYYVLPPVYSTGTTMYVFKMSPDDARNNETVYQNLMASEMLVQDFKEMVKTSVIIQSVKNDLQAAYPAIRAETLKDLTDSITVTTKPATRLIDIVVKQRDPGAAAAIANKTAEIFRDKSRDLIKADSVTIMNTAEVPAVPDSPKPLQNTLISIVAGLAASIALILFIDYARRQWKVEKMQEAVKQPGLAV